MASRGYLLLVDVFCYVCGQFIKGRAKGGKAPVKMCEAYKAYIGLPVGDQHKP